MRNSIANRCVRYEVHPVEFWDCDFRIIFNLDLTDNACALCGVCHVMSQNWMMGADAFEVDKKNHLLE